MKKVLPVLAVVAVLLLLFIFGDGHHYGRDDYILCDICGKSAFVKDDNGDEYYLEYDRLDAICPDCLTVGLSNGTIGFCENCNNAFKAGEMLEGYCKDCYFDRIEQSLMQDEYDNGYIAGHDDGYMDGREEAYEEGYNDGYNDGFDDGEEYAEQIAVSNETSE